MKHSGSEQKDSHGFLGWRKLFEKNKLDRNLFSRWKKVVDRNSRNPNIVGTVFWLAMPQKKSKQAIKKFLNDFSSEHDKPHYFNISHPNEHLVLRDYLLNLKIDERSSESTILIVQNYEQIFDEKTNPKMSVQGSYWEQTILENKQLREKFAENKLIVLFTIIKTDKNAGQYEAAYQSVLTSNNTYSNMEIE